ncbi:MAG: hypothetical protein WCG38_17960 [Aestuariivirga sp.]
MTDDLDLVVVDPNFPDDVPRQDFRAWVSADSMLCRMRTTKAAILSGVRVREVAACAGLHSKELCAYAGIH